MDWQEAPQGVLVFRRGDFLCAANTTGAAVPLPVTGELLLSSGEPVQGGLLPADTTAWWQVTSG